jgi:hypothetical protein
LKDKGKGRARSSDESEVEDEPVEDIIMRVMRMMD